MEDEKEPEKKRRFHILPRRHRKKIIAAIVIIVQILGTLTSVRAIMETRTPQGAMAWAISLNTIPYVALPAYWIFGQSKFENYKTGRQRAYTATNPLARAIKEKFVDRGLTSTVDTQSAELLERIARLPYTDFNHVELLINGKATFDAMFEAIDNAKDYILVQFYIVRDDGIGREFRDRLVARAREGIPVYFLYDGIGSHGLDESYMKPLRDAGGQMIAFSGSGEEAHRFQLNFRNHRKVMVIDGREAFLGGLNLGDEYMGRVEKYGDWRDTHVKVTGPAALFVQMSFVEDWSWATGLIPSLSWDATVATSHTQTALCLPFGPADGLETGTLFYLKMINAARERLWIASPYFVPDQQMMSALQLAALRGVDVRVLVPHKSDSFIVGLAMKSFIPACEEAGIKVFWYKEDFMHQKVILADHDLASVGTANFDNRSFRLNFEIMLVVKDALFNTQVAEMLEKDFARSTRIEGAEIKEDSFPQRFMVNLTRLFAPVL
ncbi:cardiolipin synthase [candidate division BRC1 bacterium HGW-BRC1-1]|jgi:cardiolipin synthase|nr:MAG: cardiolipin synthase [candidate division BRC1 bacterium HGW-BRC1-1]